MTFTSNLHNMQTEVAKAVAAQIPGYFETCKEMESAILLAFEKSQDEGDKKFQVTFDRLTAYQDYLKECCDKATSDEAKLAILKQIGEVNDEMLKLRAESAKEDDKRFSKFCLVILGIACLAAAAVGVNSNLGNGKRLIRA